MTGKMPDTTPSPDRPQATSDDHDPGVGCYEVEDGTVFYDSEDPLAWIQTNYALPVAQMR